jgi:hypothetical protein
MDNARSLVGCAVAAGGALVPWFLLPARPSAEPARRPRRCSPRKESPAGSVAHDTLEACHDRQRT